MAAEAFASYTSIVICVMPIKMLMKPDRVEGWSICCSAEGCQSGAYQSPAEQSRQIVISVKGYVSDGAYNEETRHDRRPDAYMLKVRPAHPEQADGNEGATENHHQHALLGQRREAVAFNEKALVTLLEVKRGQPSQEHAECDGQESETDLLRAQVVNFTKDDGKRFL